MESRESYKGSYDKSELPWWRRTMHRVSEYMHRVNVYIALSPAHLLLMAMSVSMVAYGDVRGLLMPPRTVKEMQRIVNDIKRQGEEKYAALSEIEEKLEKISEDGKWSAEEVKDFEKLLSSVYSSPQDKKFLSPPNEVSWLLYDEIEEKVLGDIKKKYDQLPEMIGEWKLWVGDNQSEGLDLEKTSIDEYVKGVINNLEYKFENPVTKEVKDSLKRGVFGAKIAQCIGLGGIGLYLYLWLVTRKIFNYYVLGIK